MSRHSQITAALRKRLLQGEWRAGTLLPTTQELAHEFGTSVFTVQTAMASLVAEGLIERRRSLGTVVRHNPAVLTCAGIYCSSSLLDEWEYAFYRELCRQLQQQLGDDGIRTVLHLDMRPAEEKRTPLPELAEAVDNRHIQALFVVLTDDASTPWLRELPVTTSSVCYDPALNPVGFDGDQMLRLALERLREQGCETIGAISAIEVPRNPLHPHFRFYKTFVSTIADLGLRTRDDWVITPPAHVPNHEQYGYESCKALWRQAERPDGILVYPDTSARGTVMALLEFGVRVPEELKLVCHRNTGVDWSCPLPVDWVVSDVSRWAATMVEQVQCQKRGESIEPVHLTYELRTGNRAGKWQAEN